MNTLFSRTIEWLRFAMAACIVLLHTSSLGAESPYPVYSTLCILFPQGICRLAVPIFFFISGFLFFHGLEEWDTAVWKNKVVRRVHSLVIPYILWNAIAAVCLFSYSVLRAKFGSGTPVSLLETWQDWNGLRLFWDCNKGMPLDYPLWFIRNLFIFVLFTPLIYAAIKYLRIFAILLVGTMYFLGIYSPLEGVLFFMSGAYFCIKKIDILKSFSSVKIPAAILSVFSLICLTVSYKTHPELYRIAKGIFVICGTVVTFNLVSHYFSKGALHIHGFLSSASFFIFASHGILILHDFARFIILHLLPGSGEWWECIAFFLQAALATVICLFLYHFFDKTCPTLTTILNGGRKMKQISG